MLRIYFPRKSRTFFISFNPLSYWWGPDETPSLGSDVYISDEVGKVIIRNAGKTPLELASEEKENERILSN